MPPMMMTFTESARKSSAWWPAEEPGILRHHRALLRVLEVRLERHHAGLLDQLEELVLHAEQLEVVVRDGALGEERLHLRRSGASGAASGVLMMSEPEGGAADDEHSDGCQSTSSTPPCIMYPPATDAITIRDPTISNMLRRLRLSNRHQAGRT